MFESPYKHNLPDYFQFGGMRQKHALCVANFTLLYNISSLEVFLEVRKAVVVKRGQSR
jgi:hypothetical protein